MNFFLASVVSVPILHLDIGVNYILSTLYCRSSDIKADQSILLFIAFSVSLSWVMLILHLSQSSSAVVDEWRSLLLNFFGGCISCSLIGCWLATYFNYVIDIIIILVP